MITVKQVSLGGVCLSTYYEESKSFNQRIAKETLDILKRGFYRYNDKKIDLHLSTGIYDFEQAEVFDTSRLADILEDSDQFMKNLFYCPENHNIEVVDSSAIQEALKIYRPFILTPMKDLPLGTSFLEGANTYDAWLCRITSLYASWQCPQVRGHFYSQSKNRQNATQGMIFSPQVAVFRDDNEKLLEFPYPVSIMSVACGNFKNISYNDKTPASIDAMMKEQIRMFLLIAARNMYRNVILMDWGCDEDGQDAYQVASYFREILLEEEYRDYFENIIFALGKTKNHDSLVAFREAFSKENPKRSFFYEPQILKKTEIVQATMKKDCNEKKPANHQLRQYIQAEYPFPVCNHKISEKDMKISLGYVEGIFEDGIPFAAELIHSSEMKKTSVIFVLPYLEQFANQSSYPLKSHRAVLYHEGILNPNWHTLLCRGMYDARESVSSLVLNKYIDYLVEMGAIELRDHVIEGFTHVLYDFGNHKVIAIELSLMKQGTVEVVVPFQFRSFTP